MEKDHADPNWFRAPNRREHWIAAGLSLGFAIFFFAWFYLQRGWWFRWAILGLGIISILHGAQHASRAMARKNER
jgi:hypothetical protein